MAAVLGCSKKNADATISISENDAEMNAAIAKARETLPQFWLLFDHPQNSETDFCLKVMIKDKDQVEHFWAVDIERKDGKVFGVINNDPEFVRTVKIGERIEIPASDISDWLYEREGKMYGNYTLRVLMKHMSKKEAEAYKQMLADP